MMKKFVFIFVLIIGVTGFVFSCGDSNFVPYDENPNPYIPVDSIQNPIDSIQVPTDSTIIDSM